MTQQDTSTSAVQNPTLTAHIVNAFVKDGQGGNPAGVILDADGYTDAQMLEIAGKVGLSETAFVSRSDSETIKLDFFTPNRRIAHCGHATIATFSYLASIGRVGEGAASKETVDGPRKILIKDGAAYMEQLAPKYSTEADWTAQDVKNTDVLRSLGLNEDQLDPRIAPTLVNTGNSFLIIAVKDAQTLQDIIPQQDQIGAISERLDLIGYYVFTTDRAATKNDATTRMFAPRYAIDEEAATGMAAGPLACLLHDRLGVNQDRIIIEQGNFMTPASPSLITVDLSRADGQITGLMAGGYGKVMQSIEIEM